MRIAPWIHQVVILACAALCLFHLPASAQTAFYQTSDAEAEGPPGSLVRQEPIVGAPRGMTATRVLYRSTSFEGKPILVSGVIIMPEGSPPAKEQPIIAWAHPTSGIVPHCAPSLAVFFFEQVQGLREMIARGYIVAATDYPGLGTAGPHPYLVGTSEGRAVIDSVRVARAVAGSTGNRFTVWGHSQGGQAALFTGLIAKAYAPELDLVGVAAAAPATDLALLMNDDMDTTGGKNVSAMTIWSWSRIYDAPMHALVDPLAVPTINILANECIESVFDLLLRQRTGKPLETHFLLSKHPGDVEPWHRLLASNSPGVLSPDIPVFLAQGTEDDLIRPAVTDAYMKRLCAAGSTVRMLSLPGVNHAFAARDSASAAVAWMTSRFAGEAPPSDCPR